MRITKLKDLTRTLGIIAGLGLVAGCGDIVRPGDNRTNSQPTVELSTTTTGGQSVPALPADIQITTTASGLQYADVEVGSGKEAKTGDSVSMTYTGYLTDGTIFDSNVGSGQPYVFPLGGGQVIQGWDEGIVGMKEGGKRRLIIPPALGYGAQGSGPIPPNSELIFDVELNGISEAAAPAEPNPASAAQPIPALPADAKVITTASGLQYAELENGTGSEAKAGDMVAVFYTGYLADGTIFDSVSSGDPLTFEIGKGQVIQGWDEGIVGMKQGGKRRLIIPSDLGYGAEGAGGGIVPPNADLTFDVELLGILNQ